MRTFEINMARPRSRASGKSTKATTRIIIVDDHELVRFGFAQLLSHEPDLEVCGEAADAPTAMRLIREQPPDLAIVDISLKGGNGLDLIKQIKASFPDVAVVVCSIYDEGLYAERVLQAGAAGYVNKQQPADTVVTAIRRVLEGKIYVSPAMTDRLLAKATHRTAGGNASPVELLSDRELEVFRMIGAGSTIKEIARQLHLSSKTIEYHREHIKQKLDLKSSSELARYAVAWTLAQG